MARLSARFAGEIVSGKRLVKAGRAGWGTLLGNIAGMVGKLAIGLAMVTWFLVATPSPFVEGMRPGGSTGSVQIAFP